MILSVYFSAQFRFWAIHRFASNLLLKACIVTPIARFAGAMCQIYAGKSQEFGYYYGIGGVTMLSTFWALTELYFAFMDNNREDKEE